MATPFASGYAPINMLYAAIQAQDARGQQGYLDAQKINEAAISDALNRAVQQKALQQQAAAQQQHYGLQQQQLANDLAYRNQALGLQTNQQAEAKRQFDAKLAIDKAIADANIAQMNKPGYGMGKDFGPMMLQSAQDADKLNQESEAAASELNRKKQILDAQHDAVTTKIKKEWHPWSVVGGKSGADLLAEADGAYAAALAALKQGTPGAERTRFDPIKNVFESLRVSGPAMPGSQPQGQPTPTPRPGADSAPAPTGGSFVPDFGGNAPVPAASSNPFLSSPFMQQIMTGQPTYTGQTPPAPPVNIPAVTNRVLRYNPNTGLLMPIQ